MATDNHENPFEADPPFEPEQERLPVADARQDAGIYNEAWARMETLRNGSGLIEAYKQDPGLEFGTWAVAQTVEGGVRFTEAREFGADQITLDGDQSLLSATVRLIRAAEDVDFIENTANIRVTPDSFLSIATFRKIEHGTVMMEGMLPAESYTVDDFLSHVALMEGNKGVPAPNRQPRHLRPSRAILRILDM